MASFLKKKTFLMTYVYTDFHSIAETESSKSQRAFQTLPGMLGPNSSGGVFSKWHC